MTARWVVWLDEITADQWQMVGGKAVNLGRMQRAGFRVPPGFCITTAAYRAFVAGNDLEAEIEALAGGGTADPYALFDRPMDEALEREIMAACGQLLDTLPKGSKVAVRSSATTEDLAEASFAGVMNYGSLSFLTRKMAEAMEAPQGDFRDWGAITQWAASLVPVLAGDMQPA